MYTYLKYDTFDDLSVLSALLSCLGLQVLVNLSWSHHVLFKGHKIQMLTYILTFTCNLCTENITCNNILSNICTGKESLYLHIIFFSRSVQVLLYKVILLLTRNRMTFDGFFIKLVFDMLNSFGGSTTIYKTNTFTPQALDIFLQNAFFFLYTK